MTAKHCQEVDKILHLQYKIGRAYTPYNGFPVPHETLLSGSDEWVSMPIALASGRVLYSPPDWWKDRGTESRVLQFNPEKTEMCLKCHRPRFKNADHEMDVTCYIRFYKKTKRI